MLLLTAEMMIEAERDAREAHARAAGRWTPHLPPSPPHPFVAAGALRAGRLLVRAGTRLQAMSTQYPVPSAER